MYQTENIYVSNNQPMDGTAAETVADFLPFLVFRLSLWK